MKNTRHLNHRYLFMAAVFSCALAGGAYAQNVYRVTNPDGSVVYTDAPRANDNAVRVGPTGGGTVSATPPARRNTVSIDADSLPYQVRRAYQAYPVTLYTTDNCPPCNDARAYLKEAGIPYAEYTVTTPQDIEALKKETSVSTSNFPVLKVGNRTLPNFQKQEWDNYMNAAGYPKTSQLPASYNNPAAQPLTDPATAAKPEQRIITPETVRRVEPTPSPTPNNNPNIRF